MTANMFTLGKQADPSYTDLNKISQKTQPNKSQHTQNT